MARADHPVVLPATRYTGIGVWDRAAARERSFRLALSDRKRLHVSTPVIHSASRVFGRGDTVARSDTMPIVALGSWDPFWPLVVLRSDRKSSLQPSRSSHKHEIRQFRQSSRRTLFTIHLPGSHP